MDLGGFGATLGVFHSRQRTLSAKWLRFNVIRVAREGTRASFSTVLAFGVLEIFGSPLALS
jgi:hypothetical protein